MQGPGNNEIRLGGFSWKKSWRLSNSLTADFCVEALEEAIARYATFYNTRRPHSSLDRQTPDHVYFKSLSLAAAA